MVISTGNPTGSDTADLELRVSELYHRHWVGLVRFAVLLLDDHAAAEDAVQESFGDLLRGWHRLKDKDKALAYLRKAVLNRSRSALRRRRTVRLHVLAAEQPAGSAEQAVVLREDHAEVQRALGGLPRRMREVLVLRYYLELSFADIAQTLGIGESSARATATRGIAALNQRLKDLR